MSQAVLSLLDSIFGLSKIYRLCDKLFAQKLFILCSRGRGTLHMKGVGMLVVSLRGVNFGFWSHLGCSGQNAIIFACEGLVKGCTRENIKIYILSVF